MAAGRAAGEGGCCRGACALQQTGRGVAWWRWVGVGLVRVWGGGGGALVAGLGAKSAPGGGGPGGRPGAGAPSQPLPCVGSGEEGVRGGGEAQGAARGSGGERETCMRTPRCVAIPPDDCAPVCSIRPRCTSERQVRVSQRQRGPAQVMRLWATHLLLQAPAGCCSCCCCTLHQPPHDQGEGVRRVALAMRQTRSGCQHAKEAKHARQQERDGHLGSRTHAHTQVQVSISSARVRRCVARAGASQPRCCCTHPASGDPVQRRLSRREWGVSRE